MAEPKRRTRRYDPQRRDRIADAALEVIAERGIEALTHRAVAQVANVQVGSTTYHFASKEDLLLAAIERSRERSSQQIEELFLMGEPDRDLAGAIAFFLERLTQDKKQLAVDYEVFLAARRMPALHDAAERWVAASFEQLEKYTDSVTARVLADLIEGWLVQAIVLERSLNAIDTLPLLHRVIRGA